MFGAKYQQKQKVLKEFKLVSTEVKKCVFSKIDNNNHKYLCKIILSVYSLNTISKISL